MFVRLCTNCGKTFRVHDRNKLKYTKCGECYANSRYGDSPRNLLTRAIRAAKDDKSALQVAESRSSRRVPKLDL